MRRDSGTRWVAGLVTAVAVAGLGIVASCSDGPTGVEVEPLDPALVAQGRDIFRFDTFGDEKYWTDTLRMQEVVQQVVTPAVALGVGLKVDAEALPPELVQAVRGGQVDLNSTATTVALLKLNAVVGLRGQVETTAGRDTLLRLGVTCALCHSMVDNSVAPGIGRRLDGWPNRDLDPGAIVALSPAVAPGLKAILQSWGPGRYDPRTSLDGLSTPLVLPPAYGLRGVDRETYTAEGPVSYWNAYVAVTQMHGQGNFSDPRLGVRIVQAPDLVTSKLPALREYQLSLETPPALRGSFDPAAARRGRLVFDGPGGCASCHTGSIYSDVNAGVLHRPEETGMDPGYAERTPEKRYRTTPLRGLWQHAPYFHDGSAATLRGVIEHYVASRNLALTEQQKLDLEEFLKTL